MGCDRLPVLATALRGYQALARDWRALLLIVLLPLGVLVVLDFQIAGIWQEGIENPRVGGLGYDDGGIGRLIQLDSALAIILFGLIAALWHRVRIAGPQFLSIFGLLAAWRNIVALTLLWSCLIIITVSLTWFFISMIPTATSEFVTETLLRKFGLISYPRLFRVLSDLILQGAPLLVALHITGRLGLMLWCLPGEGDGALDRAWLAGQGNGWRVAAAIFLATVPFSMLESVLTPLPDALDPLLYFMLWPDITELIQVILAAAVISAAYGALTIDTAPTSVATPSTAIARNQ